MEKKQIFRVFAVWPDDKSEHTLTTDNPFHVGMYVEDILKFSSAKKMIVKVDEMDVEDFKLFENESYPKCRYVNQDECPYYPTDCYNCLHPDEDGEDE